MNSVITDLYAKKDPRFASTGSGSVDEKTCPVVRTSSGVSFSIDRTGNRPSHTHFESDQSQESSTVLSDSVTGCDAVPVTARTPQKSPTDDVILIEDNCGGDQHFNTDTSMTLSSAPANVNRCCSDEQKLVVIHWK